MTTSPCSPTATLPSLNAALCNFHAPTPDRGLDEGLDEAVAAVLNLCCVDEVLREGFSDGLAGGTRGETGAVVVQLVDDASAPTVSFASRAHSMPWRVLGRFDLQEFVGVDETHPLVLVSKPPDALRVYLMLLSFAQLRRACVSAPQPVFEEIKFTLSSGFISPRRDSPRIHKL